MRAYFLIACMLLGVAGFAQKKKNTKAPATDNKLKTIAAGDTVTFVSHSAGCFHSYTHTYVFVKQKNNERVVIYKKDTLMTSKPISAANYDAFISKFDISYKHFKSSEGKNKCTTVSKYQLNHKGTSLDFTNGSCEAEYEPERLLMSLLK